MLAILRRELLVDALCVALVTRFTKDELVALSTAVMGAVRGQGLFALGTTPRRHIKAMGIQKLNLFGEANVVKLILRDVKLSWGWRIDEHRVRVAQLCGRLSGCSRIQPLDAQSRLRPLLKPKEVRSGSG